MSDTIVCKFGGSSVAEWPRIVDIVKEDDRRRVVVVSAVKGVTDALIELANADNSGRDQTIDKIVELYRGADMYTGNETDYLVNTIRGRLNIPGASTLRNTNPTGFEDTVKALGEQLSAEFIAKVVGYDLKDARDIFIVDGNYGNAKILDKSKKLIRERLQVGNFIVPGFYGNVEGDRLGIIATFSRGGSDLSAAYIAGVLKADYENWTDKNGILAADPDLIDNPLADDPNLVDHPRVIREITFKEMRDLAYSGFRVLHPETIEPIEENNIIMNIRNTFNPQDEGTRVYDDRPSDPEKPIVGVAYQDGFCSFDIRKIGLNETQGILLKILEIFDKRKLSIEHIPTGIDDVSVILKENQIENAQELKAIKDEVQALVGNRPDYVEHLGCLVVAGKGLRNDYEVTPTISKTLYDVGIKPVFFTQGSLRSCIIYGIESKDGRKAVNVVYDKFLR